MPVNRGALAEITAVVRGHWSLRRAGTWAGFGLIFVFLRSVGWLARKVDDLLWPEIANQKIERPVFIFANARSGTTLLHRLMSLDEERFASFKLYQTFCCTVSARRVVEALERFDRHIWGHPLRRIVDWINATAFSGWDGIHEMGVDEPEEDEGLFALCLNTPSIVLLAPWVDEFPGVRWFDEREADERSRFLDVYEDALRRHLFASGGNRTFLNKNALFASRVRSMFERFPDARFVYLVRHPYDALPSFLSMFHHTWTTHSPEIAKDSPEVRALARLAIDYLRYALDCRKLIPPERFRVVRYDDLVADPRATIDETYAWLGLPLTDDFRERLDAATERHTDFVSEHCYTLEQFGLSRAEIYAELKDVFKEFGFER